MSELANRINAALSKSHSIWLNEHDGSSHQLNAVGSRVTIIEGKGSEYIEVADGKSTILFNLNMIKSIKIT
ncbi:hypothetical protein [Legionella spiritensis]|uniref:Uncharacterized protein n=1 Tax=Legionella spiritensis TaxID=452 RepID=A0A0W0Z584_LEGSP|nr:hypothetical protein [Legionella spiritensis]KTD64314.1 hypothetical protein Lspi_1121 [Legionella spiritensis]SNV46662.1 Uncharacterised protein [Legionella spiritensis]